MKRSWVAQALEVGAVLLIGGAVVLANGSEWLDVVTAGDVVIALAVIAGAFIVRAGR